MDNFSLLYQANVTSYREEKNSSLADEVRCSVYRCLWPFKRCFMADCDILLRSDTSVSRKHALLLLTEDNKVIIFENGGSGLQ